VTALPLGQRNHNLPAEVTPFIGRRRELPAIAAAVERHRLVTLRGAAGVGKTRLALRTGTDLSGGFADGCWLVQLSSLHDPELLPRAVSEALGLPDDAGADPLRMLADHLAGRGLLLILDTCEHLTEACAELAGLLLSAAPRLRVLATSRAPLGAPVEHVLLISPLELPGSEADGVESDAVTLFVDRARAAVPGFELVPENAAAVAQLCRRLDGIPLALELAAVRLRGMPVEEILARLSDRFRVLGSTRTSVDRHRTLRAAVSWSYELCTRDEQRLWAELSVFPGGFGLAAAERVCGPGTAATLSRLVEKSILSVAGDRYELLDTMREFGAEHLGAAAGRVRGLHRDYYLELAEQASAALMGTGQPAWLRRLGAETANLREALEFAFTAPGEAKAGLRMTRLLLSYWLMTGHFSEGRGWLEQAAAAGDAGDGGAGDDDVAWAVFGAGVLAVQQGDFTAGGPLLARAAGLAAAAGDEDLAAHVTDARGILAFNSGDLDTARAEYEAALAVYQRSGFTDPAALVTYGRLASVCLLTFDLDRAVALCEECLRRCDETGEQWARGTALWVRGGARWLSGDNAAAIGDALACLRIKDEAGDLHTTAMCFDLLSVCLVATGEFERAAVLYGAGDALWTLLSAPVLMGPGYAEIRKGGADTARGHLGGERFTALAGYGAALPLSAAIAVAAGDAPAVPPDGVAAGPGAGLGAAPAAGGPAEQARRLTGREREVAALVAVGLGNREIAERLFLSKRTVDSHIEHIFTKLGFSSRTQLASWVLEQGVQS
jgi:non-specific serine/threonine protein kinase